MAVAKTGAIYKTLTFDGFKSSNYGVYITGQAVFNAPERAVEMITIPGRDGAFAQDQGRFENIEVTYPAGIFADTESDFADAISDFRNILCSREGYCRLIDDYNPNEYRMAIYKSGLEVSPAQLKAGEFNITFECQPQRFLTSGETKSTLSSPATVNNPTRFPSKPQLQVNGYGDIDINGGVISVENVPLGDVVLYDNGIIGYETYIVITVDTQYANAGDAISFGKILHVGQIDTSLGDYFESVTASAVGTNAGTVSAAASIQNDPRLIRTTHRILDTSFVYGTSKTATSVATFNMATHNHGALQAQTQTITVQYNGAEKFTINITNNVISYAQFTANRETELARIILDSTKSALGNPMYIDLGIGEAYKVENNVPVSVNNAVSIPAELPVLKPGGNAITFDNTFTKVEIVPRYWIV